ncbi:MAG: 2-dehydropantoate 2-reductase [Bacillota bacterium]|nr:2-dehydropantoate 2-reductase [Bacillota bacterium]
MNKIIKNICIYGLGGVGGYFGTKMADANKNNNYNISFIARGHHLEKIKSSGLILKTKNKIIEAIPHIATDDFNELGPQDIIIICVKSYDLQEVLIKLKDKIKDETIILPLLNGVDIYERIRTVITNGIVLPACVYVGTHIEAPGVICQNGGDGKILFGNKPNDKNYYPESVVKCLKDLNINFHFEQNPYKEIWTKYMFISAYGLVTARTRKTLGQILEDSVLLNDVKNIMKEIKEIAYREGVHLDNDIVENSLAKANNFPYDTKTSYQRDVEANKNNEGDLFGGTLLRMAGSYNIDTPTIKKYYIHN